MAAGGAPRDATLLAPLFLGGGDRGGARGRRHLQLLLEVVSSLDAHNPGAHSAPWPEAVPSMALGCIELWGALFIALLATWGKRKGSMARQEPDGIGASGGGRVRLLFVLLLHGEMVVSCMWFSVDRPTLCYES